MILREGAIISAHAGILCCQSFQPVHEYIEEIMGKAVLTHEIPELEKEICDSPPDERLIMSSRSKNPKNARNKNVLVIGGFGSGKILF